MALLTQSLGATSTVIYLTERTADHPSPTLVPVVAHPELPPSWSAADWQQATGVKLLPGAELPDPEQLEPIETPPSWPMPAGSIPEKSQENFTLRLSTSCGASEPKFQAQASDLASEHQLVLPMAHEGLVLGVLVSTRDGHPWQVEERQQAERIADTLTLARVMDQRGQWLEQRLQRKQLTQSYQSETFHDLLHQFRNPLTAMRTFGKLLLKRIQAGDVNQSIAEGIVRESERLQDLIQNFDDAVAVGDADLEASEHPPENAVLALPAAAPLPLPLSLEGAATEESYPRFQDGEEGDEPARSLPSATLGTALRTAPLQWADVLKPLLISANAVAEDKQIRVCAAIPENLPAVWGDKGALREVVSNLLDNALKYSPKGAAVWLLAGLFQEEAERTYQGIAIGDTGPGIPQSDQARIFERHYRGVQAAGTTPGTGLGLAIAHDLIQEMGGHITLFSPASTSGLVPESLAQAKAAGTVFLVWLPQQI
ncbi:ATP-binding protein [Pseudanabaena sp. FACHB-2040]|uniref:ATP-binding protein n=1 Tax=Pseudanabaena sp. FACHB-2040 TaxID=2692859 RepID=UPI001A7E838A